VIPIGRAYPHLLDRGAILGAFEMGPVSFFLLVIATFTLSSAALLLGGMLMERKPKRSASAVPPRARKT
jgi:hypothetical protein